MPTPRLYDDLAEFWPLISPPEEYEAEAVHLRAILREKLGPGDHSILDLGAGGGHHLAPLAGEFRAVAVDLSPAMLDNLAKLLPEVERHTGDMRTVRLNRTFDAVLIHDAISYLLSEDDIRATFATVAEHLRPGGLLIAAPDYFRENFRDQQVTHSTFRNEETDLTFIEYVHDPDPDDTTIETVMFFLIRLGGQLRVEQDRHTTGLFPRETWLRLMDQAGFDAATRPFVETADGMQHELLVGTLRG